MIINHNIPALNTYSRLSSNNLGVSKALEKLSSGLRINRAADDAAGLAISEKMRSQIKGLQQATRNVQDGISLIQTAEGALTESHSILQRCRELTIQAANDTYTASDRQEIQSEINQLTDELDRIAATTQFNGKNLLDGSSAALVSTDKISTRVFMRGGLREVDQFNQKARGGGNFKLEVEATAGQNQIQKTDIFRVKHDSEGKTIIDKVSDITTSGIKSFSSTGEPVGDYRINTVDVSSVIDSRATVDGQFQQKTSAGYGLVNGVAVAAADTNNASMYFEVTAVDVAANQVTVTAFSHQYDAAGVYSKVAKEGIILNTAGVANTFTVGDVNFTDFDLADTDHFSIGDRFGIQVSGQQLVGTDKLSVQNDTGSTREWVLNNNAWLGTTSADKESVLKSYYVDSTTGKVNDAEFKISFNEKFVERTALETVAITNGSTITSNTIGDNLQAATNYDITENGDEALADSTVAIEKQFTKQGDNIVSNATIGAANAVNASMLFEVLSIDGNNVTVRSRSFQLDKTGAASSTDQVFILTAGSSTAVGVTNLVGLNIGLADAAKISVGDKFTINTVATAAAVTDDSLTVDRYYRNPTTNVQDDTSIMTRKIVLNDGVTLNTRRLAAFELDKTSGTVAETEIVIAATGAVVDGASTKFQTTSNDAVLYKKGTHVGDIALPDSKLYDIEKFWDANGNFILERPKTITLVQGTGAKATVTITSADTINTIKEKINTAIKTAQPDGLGQGDLVGGPPLDEKFVSYVSPPVDETGLETVPGTFIIRTAMPGADGEINFVGDDAIINALSLMTIQKAVSNTFTVKVSNAHTGEVIAENVVVADNNLVGVVNRNVDVQFAADIGIKASWDETTKNFRLTGGPGNKEETYIHLTDNSMIFQIGANQQQDVMAAIGNMSTRALGMENIEVATNPLANQAIAKIDEAISRVSAERSKLGAVQNRLEHSYNNLTVTAENLTAAESRILDVDMAAEMLNFTKYNILSQASTAMLAQANQLPQTVLQLLR